MKILSLGCKTMREGVLASSIFFLAGIGMILAGTKIVSAIFYMQQIVMMLGPIMLLAPIILISTFLLSLLPGAKEKIGKCEH